MRKSGLVMRKRGNCVMCPRESVASFAGFDWCAVHLARVRAIVRDSQQSQHALARRRPLVRFRLSREASA